MAGGGGGGGARSKSSSKYYLLNMIYLSRSYMKAFILGARCPVGLAFIHSGGGWRGGRGQKSSSSGQNLVVSTIF